MVNERQAIQWGIPSQFVQRVWWVTQFVQRVWWVTQFVQWLREVRFGQQRFVGRWTQRRWLASSVVGQRQAAAERWILVVQRWPAVVGREADLEFESSHHRVIALKFRGPIHLGRGTQDWFYLSHVATALELRGPVVLGWYAQDGCQLSHVATVFRLAAQQHDRGQPV